MIFFIDTSSSWAKPCTNRAVAVFEAALAIKGCANTEPATRLAELLSNERRVNRCISCFFPVHIAP
jgi:hypothetical protein